jgi:hypothetical protein
VDGDLVAARRQLLPQQVDEGLVGELGLLEADDVGTTLVQPGGSRGTRCLTELTFQVAIRTGPPR